MFTYLSVNKPIDKSVGLLVNKSTNRLANKFTGLKCVRGMIVALSNSKGGVGKSTIAVHLAVWLAERGRKVILIDSDVQASSSTLLNVNGSVPHNHIFD